MVRIVGTMEMAVGIFLALFALASMVADVLSPPGQGIAFGLGLLLLVPALLLTTAGAMLSMRKPTGTLTGHLLALVPLLCILVLQGTATLMYRDVRNVVLLLLLAFPVGMLGWGCRLARSLKRSRAP